MTIKSILTLPFDNQILIAYFLSFLNFLQYQEHVKITSPKLGNFFAKDLFSDTNEESAKYILTTLIEHFERHYLIKTKATMSSARLSNSGSVYVPIRVSNYEIVKLLRWFF